jgi:uncharacterized phage protein gp47/JayE
MTGSRILQLAIPTLASTMARVRRAFTSEYDNQGIALDAFQADNLLHPLSTQLAHLLQQQYVSMRENASQATPFGATGPNLDAWLGFYGVPVPTEQTASGTVAITGRNNATVPSGTALIRVADGRIYTTTAPVNFGASESTVTVAVVAEAPGSAYNTAAGEALELSLISDDVDPECLSQGIAGGSDPADETTKVALMSARLAQSLSAKSEQDYRRLALESTSAVLDAFVVPAGRGPATVPIFPIMKPPADAEDWEVLPPTSGEAAAIQSYVEARRGVNDRISVEILTLRAVPLSIALTPNTAEVQANVLEALRARFAEAYDAASYTIPNSEISGAISSADGEVSHTLVNVDGAGPGADVVAPFGELAQVGTITWGSE